MKKFTILMTCLTTACLVVGYVFLKKVNTYQLDGKIGIDVLDQPVTIHRDRVGIPYIFANSMADAIRSQGFVVAQDRVFQVEMYRAIIEGKLASIIGQSGLESDIKMLVMGIRKNAERHLAFLQGDSKKYLKWYAEGYNSFIKNRQHEFPVELSLLGITPKLMTPVDLLSVQHFAGFIQGRNYQDEILSLNLASELGADKAAELMPLNINPDRQASRTLPPNKLASLRGFAQPATNVHPISTTSPVALPASGSNNWVTGSSKSKNNKPILVNDPHLDATILPGPWYPVGLFTNDVRAIGANLPGLPGLLLGRTQHISFGITNAYGDSQDLYIETIDPGKPGHYLNGVASLPFDVEHKKIAIKDKYAEDGVRFKDIVIRHTVRGPVISDHPVFGINSNQPVVFRSAAAKINGGSLGFTEALMAKTVREADDALAKIDVLYMNYIFADKNGGIAHRSTGAIPLRENGAVPKVVSDTDDWNGFIPKPNMPGQINPTKDWLGTSNHDVIPDDYPYYYSTHFSPNYRYLRTKELLNEEKTWNSEDHWKMLMDVKNKHAERLIPVFIKSIAGVDGLSDLRQELLRWDFEDQTDSVAATIFHLTHEYLVRFMFKDKLSDELLKHFLSSRYYWLQRTDELIESGESDWFDIRGTTERETLQDLIILAVLETQNTLQKKLGKDMSKWTWGKYHKVSFVSPLRQQGLGVNLLGGGSHEVSGSGETLNRGQYSLDEGPYKSQWISSLRMVADMSDDQKIMGSISGGSAARQFHPYFKSQLKDWLNEEWVPWWLDEESIKKNSVHKITLKPTASSLSQ